MRSFILSLALLLALGQTAWAQWPDERDSKASFDNSAAGLLSLGLAGQTASLLHQEDYQAPIGVGANFRLQLHNRINTEWALHYMQADFGEQAFRKDIFISANALFYPFPGNEDFEESWRPFISLGGSMNYGALEANANPSNQVDRWNPAIALGLGTHLNLTPKFDLSFSTQYMLEFGEELSWQNNNGRLLLLSQPSEKVEQRFLFSLSLNYKIADLW